MIETQMFNKLFTLHFQKVGINPKKALYNLYLWQTK
ncbi:hypothetical protein Ornrh_1127 [Ornithobacterium rhinotracheale DSM 15997]|uniref:Uncharacterized protein n=1 Tax=Ornithobacterium rhinotracheale (strain ATCC 51463 / DSM 15997 / CCUG 23171 / CIP 104009 / LMG 9086) TaxID=867902 RepID=I4A029_ORNRL|nr:hypothetical protein Ornrh_1127 [Ornithobacterium rhinotracheale DSM 15997]